jgi:Flp pilus assembly protein TadD/TolB-like protein
MIRPRLISKFSWLYALLAVSATEAAAETPEIPQKPPDGYMVLAFENLSGSVSLDWTRVAVPAALAEKLEAHPGLRPVYGPLIVPEGAPPATIDAQTVAEAAQKDGARYVFTGSVRRPEWRLELTIRLWQVDGGTATLVGEKKEKGDFAKAFEMMDRMVLDLLGKAGKTPVAPALDKIKRAPTRDFYAFTLYGRGYLFLHGLGKAPDLANAEKNLTRAVFIDPKHAEAHRVLAQLYDKKGMPAKARGRREYALDLKPDYYAALRGLVKGAYAGKDREEGIPLAAKALSMRPWDIDVRYQLGDMLWEEGDVDGAFRELKRLVTAKPDHIQARRVLVLVHATKGDGEDLARELEEVIKLDPEDEASKLDLGAAYHALGRDADAIKMYEAVAGKNPKQLQALKLLGDLHKGKGDLKTAIGWYEKALHANKNDPRPYFLLGDAYIKAGNDQKAIRIYLLAQKFPRYLGETYNNLGAIFYRLKDTGQALWYLRQASVRMPSSPRVHYNYGLALSRAKKRDLALQELMLASELDPQDADIQHARGVALLRLGRVEEAEKAFQDAVKIDGKHADALHNLRLIEELRRRAKEGEIQIE